jgi:hypothetical protein
MNCQYIYISRTTPVFYFVILPSVSSIVIVIMYHLVPTSESFTSEILEISSEILELDVYVLQMITRVKGTRINFGPLYLLLYQNH